MSKFLILIITDTILFECLYICPLDILTFSSFTNFIAGKYGLDPRRDPPAAVCTAPSRADNQRNGSGFSIKISRSTLIPEYGRDGPVTKRQAPHDSDYGEPDSENALDRRQGGQELGSCYQDTESEHLHSLKKGAIEDGTGANST